MRGFDGVCGPFRGESTMPTWAGPKKCGLIPKVRAGSKNAGQPKESSPKARTGPNNSGQP